MQLVTNHRHVMAIISSPSSSIFGSKLHELKERAPISCGENVMFTGPGMEQSSLPQTKQIFLKGQNVCPLESGSLGSVGAESARKCRYQ